MPPATPTPPQHNSSQAFDTQAPSLSITSAHHGTATGPVTYTFSFSEDVSGFTTENITVTGGTKQDGSFSGSGDTYSIVVSPTDATQGTITVDVDAGVATDAAGNSNIAATQFTQAFDTQAPSLSISSDTTAPPPDLSPSPSFSEDVSGFSAENITVTGGSKQDRLLLRFGRHLLDRCTPTDETKKAHHR